MCEGISVRAIVNRLFSIFLIVCSGKGLSCMLKTVWGGRAVVLGGTELFSTFHTVCAGKEVVGGRYVEGGRQELAGGGAEGV